MQQANENAVMYAIQLTLLALDEQATKKKKKYNYLMVLQSYRDKITFGMAYCIWMIHYMIPCLKSDQRASLSTIYDYIQMLWIGSIHPRRDMKTKSNV